MQALVTAPNQSQGVALIRDHPAPELRSGEVLIRPLLAGICSTDLEIARGYMQFAGALGHEFVGLVEDGPPELRSRRVVGEINCACHACATCRRGLPNHCPNRTVVGIAGRDGVFAERLALPAENCHVVPDEVADEQAVFVEPLAAAVHVLDVEPLTPATRVALLGTGRLGLLVAQVLATTPSELLIIGRNPRTLDRCRSWGLNVADVADFTPETTFDVVVDCTGAPAGLSLAMQLCRPCGTIILKSTFADAASLNPAPVVINETRIVGSRCGSFPPAIKLLAAGRIRTADLVTATYSLNRATEAFAAAGQPDHIKILLQVSAS